MSPAPEFVCKHCGSDEISVEVEARGWMGGGIAVDANGKPYYESDGRTHYNDFDFDEIGYECDKCGATEFKLDKLVVVKQADGQLTRPCGRCDHFVQDHEPQSCSYPKHFVRPLMPCSVEGCDCHDYYDLAIANAGITVEIAA